MRSKPNLWSVARWLVSLIGVETKVSRNSSCVHKSQCNRVLLDKNNIFKPPKQCLCHHKSRQTYQSITCMSQTRFRIINISFLKDNFSYIYTILEIRHGEKLSKMLLFFIGLGQLGLHVDWLIIDFHNFSYIYIKYNKIVTLSIIFTAMDCFKRVNIVNLQLFR